MTYGYHILEVFTPEKGGGNPLAVVEACEDLDDTTMLKITRDFGLSETAFVLPPDNPMHSARLRIFTPAEEVPFAGHPVLGTAIHIAQARAGTVTARQASLIALETGAGVVRVAITLAPGQAPYAEFDSPGLPRPVTPAPDRQALSMALGLTNAEIGFENHTPTSYHMGLNFVMVPVHDLKVMSRITLNEQAWEEVLGQEHSLLYVYCRDTWNESHHFHARAFAPLLGIPEDPATGSAATALAGAITKFDAPPEGLHTYIIEQGYEMQRPGKIHLEIVISGRKLSKVRIGGHAIGVEAGELPASMIGKEG